MVSCCQKASLLQECVLKVQTLLKKFLHPRFPVADSQEKAVIEWCSNRNSLGCCCKRRTQNKEIPGLLQFWSLHLLHTPGTHLCVEWGFSVISGVVLFLPGSFLCVPAVAVTRVTIPGVIPGCSRLQLSWAGATGRRCGPSFGRDLPAAPLSSAAQSLGIIWYSQCPSRN